MWYKIGCFGILDTDEMEDKPLVLLDGGIEKRNNEIYNFNNAIREDYGGYLFQYTLEGKGYFEKYGHIHEMNAEKGFLVAFPEQSHYYISKNQSWEFIYIHFTGQAAKPFVDKIKKFYDNPFTLSYNSAPIRMAIDLQSKILDGYRLKKYEGGEFVYRFLCALLREFEQPKVSDTLIQQAIRIIEEEYNTILGVQQLAERMNISFSHFSRSFKDEIGISPVQYLTNLRIQKAMNDLLNTKETIQQIAIKNGYSNGNYFCNVFRKIVGITPTQYRIRNKGLFY